MREFFYFKKISAGTAFQVKTLACAVTVNLLRYGLRNPEKDWYIDKPSTDVIFRRPVLRTT